MTDERFILIRNLLAKFTNPSEMTHIALALECFIRQPVDIQLNCIAPMVDILLDDNTTDEEAVLASHTLHDALFGG